MKNLIIKVTEENQAEMKRTIENLHNEEYKTLNYYLTDLRIRQLNNGEITRDKAVEIATKKVRKEYAKKLEKTLEKIKAIEEAEAFNGCTIEVNWSKGQFGANQAKAILCGCGYIEGSKTGGCGYDKESTAIAEVFNRCFPLMKLLYNYRNNHTEGSNGEIFGYGSGHGFLPSFEGGVGTSSFYGILETVGCKMRCVASGKKYDIYEITKAE